MRKVFLTVISLIFYISPFSQNVGIGTTTPKARLHVADSSVVFSAVGDVPANVANPPISGAGRRMMWYADKAAFRVGSVSFNQWDNANVGNFSFASGYNTKAVGSYSFATGYNTLATGDASFAAGYSTRATGFGSIAMGSGSEAKGYYSTAIGLYCIAAGDISTAFGYSTVSNSLAGTVVGIYNDRAAAASADFTDFNNRLFQIGNGYVFNNSIVYSNAMTVLHSGNVGIGTTLPTTKLEVADEIFSSGNVAGYKFSDRALGATKAWSWFSNNGSASLWEQSSNQNKLTVFANGNATLAGTLTQSSDARLKTDIAPLQNAMEKIEQLNGYTYNWLPTSGRDTEPQIGLLAQNVETVFPELVQTDAQGYKSVAYQNLVPVLIEAVKDQQKIINKQMQQINQQQAALNTLLEEIKAIKKSIHH